jgi:Metallo-peptidase family M12
VRTNSGAALLLAMLALGAASVDAGVPGHQRVVLPIAPDVPVTAEPTVVDVPPKRVSRLLAIAPGHSITLSDWPVGPGRTARVRLERHDVYAPRARIVAVVGGKQVDVPRSGNVYLWGWAEDGSGTGVMVAITPRSGRLQALMTAAGHAWALEPQPGDLRKHVLRDVKRELESSGVEPRWTCGEETISRPIPLEAYAAAVPVQATRLATLHTAVVAIDTDNELMAQKFGDDTTAAANYIATLFASINVMYERDLNVRLLEGTTILRVSTTPDPYTQEPSTNGTATANQLYEFADYWAANEAGVDRAVAMLLSGKSPSVTLASGIAFIDSLCDMSYGYSFFQVFKIDYLGGDTLVGGHEIGHNLGSPHTHCYSPPIDHCYNTEPGCYTGTKECPTPQTINGVTNVTGTLMSYCHLSGIAGCSSSLVFHPTVVALIDTRTSTAACVTDTAVADTTPPDISNVSVLPRLGAPGQSFTIGADVVDTQSEVASVTAIVRDHLGTLVDSLPMGNPVDGRYEVAYDSTGAADDTYSVDIDAVDSSPAANEQLATGAASFGVQTGFTCDLVLSSQTVTTAHVWEACGSITAGPSFAVQSGGAATLRAGSSVVLRNGFSVASGGQFTAAIDSTLNPP